MAAAPNLDLVRMTVTDLQGLLQNRQLTSLDLVKQCLAQIAKHNRQGISLRAVISTSPESIALATASKLDQERAAGTVRGPLHGIPIILKDAVITHSKFGMPTTVGSFALMSAKANKSARIVEKLEEEGMIILAKTNLNELSSWKTMGSSNGWSAVGGQSNSPYVKGGTLADDGVMGHTNPCGASTGSAIGVAAGFSPAAIGTEVDGSLVQPAGRAALYALKPTIGSTELEGVFAVSEDFDSLGGMAKSTKDLALLTNLVVKPEVRAKLPRDGYASLLQTSFTSLNVGFVDPELWYWPANVQPQHEGSLEEIVRMALSHQDRNSVLIYAKRKGFSDAMKLVKNNGGHVVHPVALPPASAFMMDDGAPATITAIRHVFKSNVDAFLQSYESSEVRTAEDLVEYNKEHADKELPPDHPEQGRLTDTIDNPIGKDVYDKAFSQCRRVAREEGIDKALKDNDIDIIALPLDSPSPRLAAAAGYPIATVPMGTISYNGRPFGLAIIATGGREDLLFKFMSAFEANTSPRPLPQMLIT